MAPKTLHEGWSALTGIGAALGSTTPVAAPAPGVSAEALLPAPSPSQSTRSNDVPLLIQDPFNVLLSHFLLLPFNVDTAYFLTIVKACYNLTLTQARFRFLLSASSKKCSDFFPGYDPCVLTGPRTDDFKQNVQETT